MKAILLLKNMEQVVSSSCHCDWNQGEYDLKPICSNNNINNLLSILTADFELKDIQIKMHSKYFSLSLKSAQV